MGTTDRSIAQNTILLYIRLIVVIAVRHSRETPRRTTQPLARAGGRPSVGTGTRKPLRPFGQSAAPRTPRSALRERGEKPRKPGAATGRWRPTRRTRRPSGTAGRSVPPGKRPSEPSAGGGRRVERTRRDPAGKRRRQPQCGTATQPQPRSWPQQWQWPPSPRRAARRRTSGPHPGPRPRESVVQCAVACFCSSLRWRHAGPPRRS